jgi:hypothetical protein
MAMGQLLLGNRAVKFNFHHWLLLAGLWDYIAVLEIVMGVVCGLSSIPYFKGKCHDWGRSAFAIQHSVRVVI